MMWRTRASSSPGVTPCLEASPLLLICTYTCNKCAQSGNPLHTGLKETLAADVTTMAQKTLSFHYLLQFYHCSTQSHCHSIPTECFLLWCSFANPAPAKCKGAQQCPSNHGKNTHNHPYWYHCIATDTWRLSRPISCNALHLLCAPASLVPSPSPWLPFRYPSHFCK